VAAAIRRLRSHLIGSDTVGASISSTTTWSTPTCIEVSDENWPKPSTFQKSAPGPRRHQQQSQ
jgi:hypothetical protein